MYLLKFVINICLLQHFNLYNHQLQAISEKQTRFDVNRSKSLFDFLKSQQYRPKNDINININYNRYFNRTLKTSTTEFLLRDDILLTDSDLVDSISPSSLSSSQAPSDNNAVKKRIKRAATSVQDRLWQDGIIPFQISEDYKNDLVITFIKAMRLWESQSCILFVERNDSHSSWINILEQECGCCSMVGKIVNKGPQNVSLGRLCDKVGIAAHEYGHVIGFWHEHTRPDRDNFVQILYNNIQQGQEGNFWKKNASEIDTLGEQYDFSSIMHYANNTFSNSESLPTIAVKDKYNTVHIDEMGQRNNLSKIDVIQTNKLYKCNSCMQTFYNTEDTIVLPKPNRHKTCIWRVKSVSGVRIRLKIDNFDIGPANVTCRSNHVSIFDGPTNKSSLLTKSCGNSLVNLEFTTTQPYLTIQYASSTAFERRVHQFKASYTSICGGIMTGSFGSISSPNFPDPYPDSTFCEWIVQAPAEYTIEIRFVYLNIEQSNRCDYDYLKVFDNANEKLARNYTFCGVPHLDSIRSNGNELLIRFNSDSSINSHGFMLHYQRKLDVCKTKNHGCDHTCVSDLDSYYCQCDDDFVLADDGKSCLMDYTLIQATDQENCGGFIDASELTTGLLRSPRDKEFSNKMLAKMNFTYPANQNCKWLIKAKDGYKIFLNITHLDIEGQKENCKYDFLRIYSLNGSDSEVKQHGLFCDNLHFNDLISSNTNKIGINFQSDGSVSRTGFVLLFAVDKDECLDNNGGCAQICENYHASYACKCTSGFQLKADQSSCEESTDCDYNLVDTEGLISSPKFPKNYPDERNCTWNIATRNGHRILLNFKFFDVEESTDCVYDYLKITDGGTSQVNMNPMALCGSQLPASITSLSREMSLTFVSDKTGSAQGFQIAYSTICGGDLYASREINYLYSHAKYDYGNYPSRQKCLWKIKTDANRCIALEFVEFEIESFTDNSKSNECQYDYVEISDLKPANSVKKPMAFCGFRKPDPIISKSNDVEIKFHTDSDQEFKGFRLSYKSMPCASNAHKIPTLNMPRRKHKFLKPA